MKNPLQDLDINCRGTLCSLLEALQGQQQNGAGHLRGHPGRVRGERQATRQRKTTLTNPKGIYAVTNLTAEKMVLVYDDVFSIKGTLPAHHEYLWTPPSDGARRVWRLQLVHPQGPGQWKMIPVFGDGRILRDFLYVEDLIDCLLIDCADRSAYGEVFNVGFRGARLVL